MEIDATEVINEQSTRIGQLTTQNIILETKLKHLVARVEELEARNDG